jgi:hypothetical protein
MNMRKLTVKILWLGVLCTGLASVPAFSQGLGTLVELARKNDPQWLLANAKFRESQEYLPQAYSQLLPSVSFTSNTNKVQQQLTNGATESPEQRYPSSSNVLSLRQPIFRSKQMFGVNSAKAQTEQAAFYLLRRPQTLRGWACMENGPLRPIRINGRLAWNVSELRRVLGVAA